LFCDKTKGEIVKILHLIYDDIENPWLGGGGAFRTLEIYKRLAKQHEITVITGNYPDAKKDEEREGVLFKRAGSSKSYLLSRATYSLNAARLVRQLDFDIVVEDFSAFSPCFTPLYVRKPIIASIQNLYSTHAIKKYKVLGIAAFLLERFGLKLYRHFIVVSPSLKDQLEKLVPAARRIDVIPNSVDESLLSLEVTERNYILFLGRIDVYQKGLDILLQAFKEIVKRTHKVKLVIVGGGKDINNLKGLVSRLHLGDSISLEDRVYGRRKEELLSSCLFVCMPSRFESFGIVAIEASASGKPVIGTKIPGLRDSIRDGETGILVKPNNTKELSEAMLRLIDDAALRKRLGQAGREWAKNFSPEQTARMTEEFYLQCLGQA